MDKIVNESSNIMMSESTDIFLPVYEQKALDYIKSESNNFKLLVKSFDINQSQLTLSEDCKSIYAGMNGTKDKLQIKVEDALSFEVNKFLRNL